MKKQLTALLLLLLAFTSSAQIVVYKGIQIGRQIGAGSDLRLPVTVFLAIDSTGSNAVSVSSFKTNGVKTFQVSFHSFSVSQVSGKGGATFTSFSESAGTNAATSFFLAYGQNTSLTVSPGVTVSAPRLLTAKPQELVGSTVWDSSLTLSFDSKDTLAANSAGQTPDGFATALEQKLFSLGYVGGEVFFPSDFP